MAGGKKKGGKSPGKAEGKVRRSICAASRLRRRTP
jgi:hypothetical protein